MLRISAWWSYAIAVGWFGMTSQESSADEQTKRVWSLGSYPAIARDFLGMAAELVTATEVGENDSVLDVACGTGNVAISAARRGAAVTGLDITPTMLDGARENATISGMEHIVWQEGSATDLPFEDNSFDVTLSCVGHMFAEPATAAGRELCRVTRPGGRIAFTAWTPSSVVPAMGAVLSAYLPPNPDPPEPPFRWGDPDVVRDRLNDWVATMTFETGTVQTPVLTPAHYWEKATTESGPFIASLEAIEESERQPLREEMVETIEQFFDERQNAVPMEYGLTTATVA